MNVEEKAIENDWTGRTIYYVDDQGVRHAVGIGDLEKFQKDQATAGRTLTKIATRRYVDRDGGEYVVPEDRVRDFFYERAAAEKARAEAAGETYDGRRQTVAEVQEWQGKSAGDTLPVAMWREGEQERIALKAKGYAPRLNHDAEVDGPDAQDVIEATQHAFTHIDDWGIERNSRGRIQVGETVKTMGERLARGTVGGAAAIAEGAAGFAANAVATGVDLGLRGVGAAVEKTGEVVGSEGIRQAGEDIYNSGRALKETVDEIQAAAHRGIVENILGDAVTQGTKLGNNLAEAGVRAGEMYGEMALGIGGLAKVGGHRAVGATFAAGSLERSLDDESLRNAGWKGAAVAIVDAAANGLAGGALGKILNGFGIKATQRPLQQALGKALNSALGGAVAGGVDMYLMTAPGQMAREMAGIQDGMTFQDRVDTCNNALVHGMALTGAMRLASATPGVLYRGRRADQAVTYEVEKMRKAYAPSVVRVAQQARAASLAGKPLTGGGLEGVRVTTNGEVLLRDGSVYYPAVAAKDVVVPGADGRQTVRHVEGREARIVVSDGTVLNAQGDVVGKLAGGQRYSRTLNTMAEAYARETDPSAGGDTTVTTFDQRTGNAAVLPTDVTEIAPQSYKDYVAWAKGGRKGVAPVLDAEGQAFAEIVATHDRGGDARHAAELAMGDIQAGRRTAAEARDLLMKAEAEVTGIEDLVQVRDTNSGDGVATRAAHVVEPVEGGIEVVTTPRADGTIAESAVDAAADIFGSVEAGEMKTSTVDVTRIETPAAETAGTESGRQEATEKAPGGTGPIVMVFDAETGSYKVVDGKKRVAAEAAGGAKSVEAVVLHEADGWNAENAEAVRAVGNIKSGSLDEQGLVDAFGKLGVTFAKAKEMGLVREDNAATVEAAIAIANNGCAALKTGVTRENRFTRWVLADTINATNFGARWEEVQAETLRAVEGLGRFEAKRVIDEMFYLRKRVADGRLSVAEAIQSAKYAAHYLVEDDLPDDDIEVVERLAANDSVGQIAVETEKPGVFKTVGETESEVAAARDAATPPEPRVPGTATVEEARVRAEKPGLRLEATGTGADGVTEFGCARFKDVKVRVVDGVWEVTGLRADEMLDTRNIYDMAKFMGEMGDKIAAAGGKLLLEPGLEAAYETVMNVYETAIKTSPEMRARSEAVMGLLEKSGLAAGVVTDAEEFAAALEAAGGKRLVADGMTYGFVKDGKVYLDPKFFGTKAGLETTVHEFGHLAIRKAQEVNRALWERGMTLASQMTDALETLRQTPGYDGYTDEKLCEEVLAKLIGKRGAEIEASVPKKILSEVKAWIAEVWKSFGASFGIADLTPEKAEKMTLEDVADAIRAEMMSGRKFGEMSANGMLREQIEATRAKMRENAKKMNKAVHAKKVAVRNLFIEEELCRPNSVFAYWATYGKLLSVPPMRRRPDGKFEFYGGDPAVEALNTFFDGMKGSEKQKWFNIIFGKRGQRRSTDVEGNDVRIGDYQYFEFGGRDLTTDEIMAHRFTNDYDSFLAEFMDQYAKFQKFVDGGAITSRDRYEYAMEEQRLKEEEEYVLDTMRKEAPARKAYDEALVEVNRYNPDSHEVKMFSTSALSKLRKGDAIKFDHSGEYMSFIKYEKGVLTVSEKLDVAMEFDGDPADNVYYEVTPKGFRQIGVGIDGRQGKKDADHVRARDAKGGKGKRSEEVSAAEARGSDGGGDDGASFNRPTVEFLAGRVRVANDEGRGERTAGGLAASRELATQGVTPIQQLGQFRKMSLPISELEWLRKSLTGTSVPAHVASRLPGGAASASTRSGKLVIAADVFGIVDRTDMAEKKQLLKSHGYFMHEDPAWCATMPDAQIRAERRRSEEALASQLERVADMRVSGAAPGGQAAARGVFADELARIVMAMPRVPTSGTAGSVRRIGDGLRQRLVGAASVDAIRDEAGAFLDWAYGAPAAGAAATRDLPPETLTDRMFGAFLVMPAELERQAPTWSDAICNTIAGDAKLLGAFQELSTRAFTDQAHKHLQEQVRKGLDRVNEQTIMRLQEEGREPIEAKGRVARMKERFMVAFHDRMAPVAVRINECVDVYVAAKKKVLAGVRDPAMRAQVQQNIANFMGRVGAAVDRMELARLAMERGSYNEGKAYFVQETMLLNEATEKWGLTIEDISLYLDMKRGIETQGRANSYGMSARQNELVLGDMARRLGTEKWRRMEEFGNRFFAIHDQEFVQDPRLLQAFGRKFVDYISTQVHYVTTARTWSPEELADIEAQRRLVRASGAHGGDDVVEQMFAYAGRGMGMGPREGLVTSRLKGSMAAKKNVLAATWEKVDAAQQFLRRNSYVISMRDALLAAGVEGVRDVARGNRDVPENARYGVLNYVEGGSKRALIVPRQIADGMRMDAGSMQLCARLHNAWRAVIIDYNPAYWNRNVHRNMGAIEKNMPGMHESWLKTALRPLGLGNIAETALMHLARHTGNRGSAVLGRVFGEGSVYPYVAKARRMATLLEDPSRWQQRLWDADARGDVERVAEMQDDLNETLRMLKTNMLVPLRTARSGEAPTFVDDVLDRKALKTVARIREEYAAKGVTRRALERLNVFATNARQQQWEDDFAKTLAYLHDRLVYGGERTEAESGRMVAENVSIAQGERSGTKKGALQATVATFFNMCEKGIHRNVRAHVQRPGETFAKDARVFTGEFIGQLVKTGALAAVILKMFDGDEEKARSSWAGEVYEWAEFMRRAYKNCSTYVKENYNFMPVWNSASGRTSVIIGMPWNDEDKVISPAAQAAAQMVAAGMGLGDGPDIVKTAMNTTIRPLAPDMDLTGIVWQLARDTVYALADNPRDGFTGMPVYDQDLYDVKLESAELARDFGLEMAKRVWNDMGGRVVMQFDRNGVEGRGEEHWALDAALRRIAIASPFLRSFIKVQTGNVDKYAKELTEQERKSAALIRTLAKKVADKNTRDGQFVFDHGDEFHDMVEEWGERYGLSAEERMTLVQRCWDEALAAATPEMQEMKKEIKMRRRAMKAGIDADRLLN